MPAETVEIHAADVFNNGFSASFPGPDGFSLFNANHPQIKSGGVQTNTRAASQLSPTSLMLALTQFRKQKDYSGRRIRVPADRLIVPPDLEFTAAEILGGTMRSDTTNNTINALRNRQGMPDFRRMVVWDYLTDPLAWFIARRRGVELQALVRSAARCYCGGATGGVVGRCVARCSFYGRRAGWPRRLSHRGRVG